MALCCLLIEALQSFREKPQGVPRVAGPCTYPSGLCIRPQTDTSALFGSFLRLPAFGTAFQDESVAKKFIKGIRNGVLHEAETRRWVIWRNEPYGQILEPYGRGYALNRTAFATAVKNEFEAYLQELRTPSSSERRVGPKFKESADQTGLGEPTAVGVQGWMHPKLNGPVAVTFGRASGSGWQL